MSRFENNAIFWIEVDKIVPNPQQPRRAFNEAALNDLAESIRQYGVLQPLTVTRREVVSEDSLSVEYELVAGERRWRASRIAGLSQVPVLIRSGEDDSRVKLEIAIIENLQREDLNPVDRAHAFRRLVDEFGFTHGQVGQKVGKSREYVSNSLRLLVMPQEIQDAITAGQISEGHARPLLMLSDKPDEQTTLFKEVLYKKLTVREAESISRRIAVDKVRKRELRLDPDIIALERKLTDALGTRVQIEAREVGGKVVIDFDSGDNLRNLLLVLNTAYDKRDTPSEMPSEQPEAPAHAQAEDDDLYAIKNFTI